MAARLGYSEPSPLLRAFARWSGVSPSSYRSSLLSTAGRAATGLVDERAQGYELFRRLRLSVRMNGYEVPRDIGLLFFNEDPDQFFRGAHIEVVQLNEDSEGELLSEHTFKGPRPEQVRAAPSHLSSLGGERVRKISCERSLRGSVSRPPGVRSTRRWRSSPMSSRWGARRTSRSSTARRRWSGLLWRSGSGDDRSITPRCSR